MQAMLDLSYSTSIKDLSLDAGRQWCGENNEKQKRECLDQLTAIAIRLKKEEGATLRVPNVYPPWTAGLE